MNRRQSDPLAPLRALARTDPHAAWRASRGTLRAPWLRAAHAVATAAASPPTLAAWAAVAGCSRSALAAARAADVELRALEVAPVGPPRRLDSRRTRRDAARPRA
jgi:AraC-like DNA-binding protein